MCGILLFPFDFTKPFKIPRLDGIEFKSDITEPFEEFEINKKNNDILYIFEDIINFNNKLFMK